MRKEFSRLYSYAQMKSDQDTRDAKYRAMTQEMQQLGATFAARTAWLEPEVLGMDRGRVEESLKVEPKLGPYRMYLGESEERILANAAPTRRARRTTCTRSCCSTTTAATRT